MNCLHCGADTTNGLILCELCQRWAESVFDHLPIYFRNLARWRPGRAGARPVPGSREPSTGATVATDRASIALDEAGAALTNLAQKLADGRPQPTRLLDRLARADLTEAETIAWLCRGFKRFLPTISTLDWAGDFLRDIGAHEAKLRSLTERIAPGWYAGACHRKIALDEHCGAPTYVVPGLTWVTCHICGSTTYARDHLEAVLIEASTWVAPPMRIAEAIVALVDTEASVQRLHKRISKWGERGHLEIIRSTEYAPKRYRLGDVLTRLATEGATRLDDAIDANAG